MTPSFYSLFRRGHYFRAPDDEDHSKEAKTQRKERERFAVATLAFCLKHDAQFLKHFLETICRVKGDPVKMPLVTADGIEIERHPWADLRITSQCRRYRWVVEAKAGAQLQDKQNPKKTSSFVKPGEGYGRFFADSEKGRETEMRYIVLGANEPLGLKDGEKRLGITVQERKWNDLLDGVSLDGVVKDLIETFAELEIADFFMKKAKLIAMKEGEIVDAVRAAIVLRAFFKHLRAGDSKFVMQSEANEDDSGCLGYWIKQPSKTSSSKYQKLKRATRNTGKGKELGWFGYEYNKMGPTVRGVYLYFNSVVNRDAMQKKLTKKLPRNFAIVEAAMDGDTHCVHVTAPLKQSVNDLEWFQSVVDYAID